MATLTLSTTPANDSAVIPHPAVEAARLRGRMERAVEKLLNAMDALDATGLELEDDEIEVCPDLEPSLGAVVPYANVPQTAWAEGGSHDLEKDNSDKEPSLGSTEGAAGFDQSRWTLGSDRDLEGDYADWETSGWVEKGGDFGNSGREVDPATVWEEA